MRVVDVISILAGSANRSAQATRAELEQAIWDVRDEKICLRLMDGTEQAITFLDKLERVFDEELSTRDVNDE